MSSRGQTSGSFVTKAYAGAIDQKLSDDMSQAEISTAVLENDSMSPEAQAKSVQLYFILIHAVARKRGVCSSKRTP